MYIKSNKLYNLLFFFCILPKIVNTSDSQAEKITDTSTENETVTNSEPDTEVEAKKETKRKYPVQTK